VCAENQDTKSLSLIFKSTLFKMFTSTIADFQVIPFFYKEFPNLDVLLSPFTSQCRTARNGLKA
jgi:hypothetical protein